jgi:magnesium transporter
MRKPLIRRQAQPGARPGQVNVDPAAPAPSIRVIAYDAETIVDRPIETVDELAELVGRYRVAWIDVVGLGDAAIIRQLGEVFDLHRLAMEDVVNVHQRAKVEEYRDHLYVVARMIHTDGHLSTEQVSMFLGENFVLTFQERADDCFTPIRKRLQDSKAIIRLSGPDYLTYRLLDAIIDAYFPVLEDYGDRLERLDERVAEHPDHDTLAAVHNAKVDLLLLRRAIWPHRDMVTALMRDDTPLVGKETDIYLRDCYDHVVQLIDLVETYREICADLRDFFMTALSNRMNEVMKVLTIIATIFIPLGFIAGVYGMNFNPKVSPLNMPELEWRWGYPFALGLMAAVAVGMLFFFRRRGWVGSATIEPPPHQHGKP